ncbi:hypothetical protein A9974_05605 [Achromobacter sp. UMC71]|nr:hypothetical protein [Achromobacter sp. UMC71]
MKILFDGRAATRAPRSACGPPPRHLTDAPAVAQGLRHYRCGATKAMTIQTADAAMPARIVHAGIAATHPANAIRRCHAGSIGYC